MKGSNDMRQQARPTKKARASTPSNPPNPKQNRPLKEILVKDSKNEKDKEDWGYKDAYATGYLNDQRPPSNKNLLKNATWWDISDQGEKYSCVGWAVTDVVHWHHVKNNPSLKEQKFSSRFTWMAAKEIDNLNSRPTSFIEKEGTTLKGALTVCSKYGAVPERLLPTQTTKKTTSKEERHYQGYYQGDAKTFYAQAAHYQITSYFNLFIDDNIEEEKKKREAYQITLWKKWLSENGPIIVRLNIDNNWRNAKKSKKPLQQHHGSLGNHAAIMVAYDEKYFTIRNSQGKDWGDAGYIKVSHAYALEAFDQTYGIVIASGTGNPGGSKKPLPCTIFPC
jgi:hypothetical protein